MTACAPCWWAVLLAGGSGSRMGAEKNKVLLPLAGQLVLMRSVRALAPHVEGLVIVCREEDEEEILSALQAASLSVPVRLARGGSTRQASVRAGLMALPGACTDVLIHDGARCLVDSATILRVQRSVEACGTGVASLPVSDTIKVADVDGRVLATPDRAGLRAMQTPQGFHRELIVRAHERAAAEGFVGTDDASLVERLGEPVQLCEGSRWNLKLTTPEDLTIARAHLAEGSGLLPEVRMGYGMDVHRLVSGRKLILCGVEIPHTLGLLGHSDADVALHALMDAMLGACALGDIGQHFPDTDPAYAGISSLLLLERVRDVTREAGYVLENCDLTIAAQQPKLMPHIPAMRRRIAGALLVDERQVSVKATTTEHLGFEGRMEGISAHAVALMRRAE